MKPVSLMFLVAVMSTPSVEAQGGQYLGPGLHPAPLPPGAARGRPNRPAGQGVSVAAKIDATRWEAWWAYNREDLLPARGLSDDGESGSTNASGMRIPTPAETRARVLPIIRAALDDRGSDVRAAACVALGRNADPKDIPLLVARLDDRDRKVVEAALTGLGYCRHPDADAALVKALGAEGRTAKERGLALLALGLSGGDAAKAVLIDGLSDDVARDRGAAARAGHADSCRILAAGLWSRGDMGDDARAPLVSEAIRGAHAVVPASDEILRVHALLGLAKVRDASTRGYAAGFLKDPVAGVRGAAATVLGRTTPGDDIATATLLVAAASREPTAEPRHAMTIALGRLAARTGPAADAAYAALLKEAKEQDRQHRAFALIALGLSKRTASHAVLRAAFTEARDEIVRGAAAVGLGIAGDRDAWSLIKEKLEKKGNPFLTCHLLNWVALTRHPEGLATAAKFLSESRDPDVVATAALTLGIGGAADAGAALTALLAKTSVPEIRAATATAVGRLGDRRQVEPLIAAVEAAKSKEETKAALIAALGLVVAKPPILLDERAVIDADAGVRIDALDYLLDLL